MPGPTGPSPESSATAALPVAALARLFDLPIPESSRAGVEAQLAVLAEMAALVRSFPLDHTYEPAPVFQP